MYKVYTQIGNLTHANRMNGTKERVGGKCLMTNWANYHHPGYAVCARTWRKNTRQVKVSAIPELIVPYWPNNAIKNVATGSNSLYCLKNSHRRKTISVWNLLLLLKYWTAAENTVLITASEPRLTPLPDKHPFTPCWSTRGGTQWCR